MILSAHVVVILNRLLAVIMKLGLFGLLTLSIMMPAMAQSVPTKVLVEYDVVRKGQPFAKVTEQFHQKDGHYVIESHTKGIGVYAILGNRLLKSEGKITERGLQPEHFELQQTPNNRTIRVDFDWSAGQITVNNKGKINTKPLPPDTQDLASLLYQSMFVSPKAGDLNFSVVTGKKIRTYAYKVESTPSQLITAIGELNVIHLKLIDALKGDNKNDADEEGKHFWLSPDKWYLLVQMSMQFVADDVLEQRITKLHVE